jgi:hypothetical protein
MAASRALAELETLSASVTASVLGARANGGRMRGC